MAEDREQGQREAARKLEEAAGEAREAARELEKAAKKADDAFAYEALGGDDEIPPGKEGEATDE